MVSETLVHFRFIINALGSGYTLSTLCMVGGLQHGAEILEHQRDSHQMLFFMLEATDVPICSLVICHHLCRLQRKPSRNKMLGGDLLMTKWVAC